MKDLVAAGDLMPKNLGSVDPSRYPAEVFELFSIPAYDVGKPEIVVGGNIGSSKKKVAPGDVLISRIVPHIRRCWVVPETLEKRQIASGEWITFRSERFYPQYLRHFLMSDGFHRQFMRTVSGVGGSLLRARPSEVERIEIPLPAMSEQKRIAAILDKADAIRRKRQQAIQLADEFLRSVFLDMFGDPAINPKGWRRFKIKEIGKVITGNTPPREQKNYYANHIEWIKTDNISAAKYFLTKAAEGLSESGLGVGRSVPAGSTLVTCIAGSPSSIGNSAYANRSVAFNQQINAIVPYQEFPALFVFGLLRASKRLIQERSTAAMTGMVSKSSLESVEVYDPPESLKARYASIFAKALADIDRQTTAETEADLLFKAVSQRAFAGML